MSYWFGLYLTGCCVLGMLIGMWGANLTDTFAFRNRITRVLREIEERLDRLEGE